MRDLMNTISGVHALGDGALIAATANGDWIDVTGLNSGNDGLCFLVDVGTVTDGTHTFSLQDSVDGGTTPVAVAAVYVQTPSGQVNAVTSATAAKTILKFGYLGNPGVASLASSALSGAPAHKILVRVIDTVTGSPATGGYFTAMAVEGYPFDLPAA